MPRLHSFRLHLLRLYKLRAALVTAVLYQLLLVSADTIRAADPESLPRLLPRSTIAYIHVLDWPALQTAASRTSLGKLRREPDGALALQWLVEHVAGRRGTTSQSADGSFLDLARRVAQAPVKQFALAVVEDSDGSGVPAVIHDADELAMPLPTPAEGGRRFYPVAHDDLHALCGSQRVADLLRSIWTGPASGLASDTLSADPVVSATLRRERASEKDRALVECFARPLPLVLHMTGDISIQAGNRRDLDAFAANGIQGLFGRLRCRTEDADWEVDLTLALPSPRIGLSQCLALGGVASRRASLEAPSWTPAHAASNLTLSWDVAKSLEALRATSIEASLSEALAPTMAATAPSITGEVSLASWRPDAPEIGALRRVTGIKCRDAAAARRLLRWLVEDGARWQTRTHGEHSYFLTRAAAHGDVAPLLSHNCYGVVDSFVLMANGRDAMDEAIATHLGERPRLADEPDYRLWKSRAEQSARDANGDAAVLFFLRPDMHLQPWLKLADPAHRDTLEQLARDRLAWSEPFAAIWLRMLQDGFVPPSFPTLRKHLTPVAGVAWDDGTTVRARFIVPARRRGP